MRAFLEGDDILVQLYPYVQKSDASDAVTQNFVFYIFYIQYNLIY